MITFSIFCFLSENTIEIYLSNFGLLYHFSISPFSLPVGRILTFPKLCSYLVIIYIMIFPFFIHYYCLFFKLQIFLFYDLMFLSSNFKFLFFYRILNVPEINLSLSYFSFSCEMWKIKILTLIKAAHKSFATYLIFSIVLITVWNYLLLY